MNDVRPGGVIPGAENHTYRCDNGHEITVEGGTWTMFAFKQKIDGEWKNYEFNYCPRCFGAWAAARFPMEEVKR